LKKQEHQTIYQALEQKDNASRSSVFPIEIQSIKILKNMQTKTQKMRDSTAKKAFLKKLQTFPNV
jgi:hypothetical protein